jgi:ABC-type multidrug transport system fused ATPase/permease subunit
MIIKRNIERIKSLYRLVGPKVALLFATAIPIGILLGMIEVVTASVLYSVLVEFQLVSNSTGAPPMTFGLAPVFALLLFSILAAVFRFLGQWLPALASHEFNRRLRDALVRSVLGGVVERRVASVAEASHLLSSVIQKSGEFVNSLTTTLVGFCLFVLILSGLVYTSWQMTSVAIAFTGILGLLLVGLRRLYGRYIEVLHFYSTKFATTFLRDVRSNYLLRILGANEKEIDRLIGISGEHIRSFRRYYFWYSISSGIPVLAGVFLLVGMFWLNARIQLLSPEGLLPLVYLLMRMGGSVGGFAAAIGQMQQNRPYIAELARYVPELFPQEDAALSNGHVDVVPFPLAVSNLQFGRDKPLLRPVDLAAGKGDTILIFGASGKGKTTLVMTLIGLLRPLGGSITWAGTPIGKFDPVQLRRRIGYAGMEPYLIDGDIRTNLLLGLEFRSVSDAEIMQALQLCCAEFVFDLDGGLSHRLSEAGDGVSAGQKQRLSLARCVLRRPDILLLDEATANLDEETEGLIMERIRSEFPDMLIILVSHRASLRRFATVFLEL